MKDRRAPLLTSLALALCVLGPAAAPGEARSHPAPVRAAARADRAAALDAHLRQTGFTGAALIARGDTVIHRGGYGLASAELSVPNTTDTKFNLGSVTKSFTAMAVLALQERGSLSVTDSVCRFLDGCPPAWREVTLHHLLTHTSGIPEVATALGYFQTFGGQRYALPRSTREVLGFVRGRPLDFAPGERVQYGNSGFIALGEVIQTATGTTWHEFLGEAILRPAGMRDTGFDVRTAILPNRAAGYEQDARGRLINAPYWDPSNAAAAGGLYSTVEDLFRWDRARARGDLFSPPTQASLFAPHAAAPAPAYDLFGAGASAFGYGWVVSADGGRPIVHHGGRYSGFSACVVRLVQEEVFVAILSNVGHTPTCDLARDITRLATAD